MDRMDRMASQYKCGDFCRYLSTYRVERGSEFSHTSIVKPSGAYYIPAEEEPRFFHLYKQAIMSNDDLHMTEKHRSISPFLIDLDFRFELVDKNIKRQFTGEHIMLIIKAYVAVLRDTKLRLVGSVLCLCVRGEVAQVRHDAC